MNQTDNQVPGVNPVKPANDSSVQIPNVPTTPAGQPSDQPVVPDPASPTPSPAPETPVTPEPTPSSPTTPEPTSTPPATVGEQPVAQKNSTPQPDGQG